MVNSYELYSQITKPLVPRQSNPFNWEIHHQWQPRKSSLQDFGWMDPLILTENPKPSLIRLKSISSWHTTVNHGYFLILIYNISNERKLLVSFLLCLGFINLCIFLALMIIFQIFFFKLYISYKCFSIILPSSTVIKIEVLVLILLLFICIYVKYPAHWAEVELVTTLTK